jgi:hypothetical protein
MATVKRISGDYVIRTTNVGDTVDVSTTVMTVSATALNVIGDLTVSGNASLSGNIAADFIFNGTTSVAIPAPNGNVNVAVGGVSNIAVFSTGGANITGFVTTTGNVTGGNVITAGLVTAAGNITGANLNTAGNVWISRDASAAQPTIRFTDTDATVADGQVLGAVEWFTTNSVGGGPRVTAAIRTIASSTLGNANVQILTSTGGAAATAKVTVLSTGNVGIGNVAPVDLLAVQGTIWGSSTVSAVGNIRGGNVNTAGLISAAGNVTSGGNIIATGYATITGNITGGNVISLGAVSAGAAGVSTVGNITGGNLNIDSAISATGNVTSGDTVIAATGFFTTGNVTGGNIALTGVLSAGGNITGANVIAVTRVTAPRFQGDLVGSVFADDSTLIVDAVDNAIYTDTVQATGNITSGNVSTGALSLSGNVLTAINTTSAITTTANITGGNLNAVGLSLSGNVLAPINTTSNITTTGNVTAGNVSVSTLLSGNGINVENVVLQQTDYELSSATPENIGSLQFTALANQAYRFDAYIVLEPSGSTTVSPAVNFSAGTCAYTTQIQTTSVSALNVATKTTSDNVTTTYNMTGTDARTLRISGYFDHTSTTTVSLRFQTSISNVTVKAGSYLVYTRTL